MTTMQQKFICPRLLDYVVICGSRHPNRNNNVAQTPELLRRYPVEDHKDFPLPNDVVFFCQPEGCINVGPKRMSLRETTSFVFTLTEKDSGIMRYGVCVNFFRPFERKIHSSERARPERLHHSGSTSSGDTSLNIPGTEQDTPCPRSPRTKRKLKTACRVRNNTLTSLCIISHHPFFSTFRECLFILRRIIEACHDRSCTKRIGGSKGSTRKRKQYFSENLRKAVGAVNRGHLSLRKAAAEYGVPVMTISNHVSGKVASFENPGPHRQLSDHDEKSLVHYIIYMAERGFPLSRKQIRCFIRQIIISRSITAKVNMDQGPSDLWFRKFYNRHPDIKERKPQKVTASRLRMANRTVINQYFSLLDETLTRLGLKDKPAQIFNCDETGFGSDEKVRQRVAGLKAKTQIPQKRVTTTDHTTALVCVSADGAVMPTFVIFSKGLPHTDFRVGVPDNWLFAASPSGFMDSELFLRWMQRVFIPNCGRERPVVLLMDNVGVHITVDIIELAVANQIELIGFPPHTTHLLQPCDVGVFGPLKKRFDELAVSLAFVNTGMVIGKAKLPTVLTYAIGQSCSPSLVRSAFEKTGIYPVNKAAIDQTLIAPEDYPKKTQPDTASTSETPPPPPPPLCEACGQWVVPHPLVAQGLISPTLSKILLPPNPKEKPAKKRKVVTEARVITSGDVLQQLRDKLEEEERKKNEKRRRVLAREEKRKNGPVERRRRVAENQAEVDSEDDEPCLFCGSHSPTVDGDGPVLWVQCGDCESWYHTGCIGITDTDADFACPDVSLLCWPQVIEE